MEAEHTKMWLKRLLWIRLTAARDDKGFGVVSKLFLKVGSEPVRSGVMAG